MPTHQGPTSVEHPYPVLPSRLERRSEVFKANYEANLAEVEKLQQALAESRVGGGERYVQRHLKKGKLLPRDRIEHLLDPDSHYLELCALAGYNMKGMTTGGSMLGGVGVVSGVECMITASEATVKGGAINEISLKKGRRLAEIGQHNNLVAISLIESAGADLPNQSKIFVPGGETFRDITRSSKARRPSICAVFGSSTAGGAYIPGMSDYVVMVKKQAKVYLAGPPLVKMATGEVTDHETLGGAEMHSKLSGVSDYLAEDELDALRLVREIVAHLNWRKPSAPTPRPIEPPRYPADDILGAISHDVRQPYDSREVIARIVDGSRFSEFKPLYGNTLVCGWAHLHGFPVGILANNGILFSESSNKGAQFIQLCNQVDVPLLFLQNITGFMVGNRYEQEGIIKNGAKLINAVSNSTVPAITIMTGASYGAGNYAMSGRAYEPRFIFTWPNHRIAVMGGKQLAGVLEIIKRDAAEKKGEELDENNLKVVKMMIEQQIDKESSPYYATARIWDDGIIDPRDTRTVVAIALSAAYNRRVKGTTSWGIFRH
jgi:acetyl-CoA carboxylase carboxyltransferase component